MKKIILSALGFALLCGNSYAAPGLLPERVIFKCKEQNSFGQKYANTLTITRSPAEAEKGFYLVDVIWKYSTGETIKGFGGYLPGDNRLAVYFKDDGEKGRKVPGLEYMVPSENGKLLNNTFVWQDGSHGIETCKKES